MTDLKSPDARASRMAAEQPPASADAPGAETSPSTTDPVSVPEPDLTGVARGSLGTGANLEETQVLRTEDLRAWAADADANTGSGVAPEPDGPRAEVLSAALPAAAAPRRRPASGDRFAGIAGGLAVLLMVLAGAAVFVITRDAGSGNELAAPAASPTTAPIDQATTDGNAGAANGAGNGGGKGDGKGKGHDNGHGGGHDD